MIFDTLIISVLTLVLGSLANAGPIYREESQVSLIGTLEVQSFPGPPNYQSVTEGDRIERGLFLKLDQAIAVTSSEGTQTAQSLQLSGPLVAKHFQEGREKSRVHAEGTLFLGFNGHHWGLNFRSNLKSRRKKPLNIF